jgi:exopolysaccharide biosynthesis protein
MTHKGILLTLSLVMGLSLAGGAVLNLSDAFLIAKVSGSVQSDQDSDSTTNTTSTSTSESGSTSAGTSSESASSSSAYASTSVALSKATYTNSSSRAVTYYVVDIKLSKATLLKSHLATSGSAYGVNVTESFSSHISDCGGSDTVLAAINGDFAYATTYRGGYVIRNGNTYRTTAQDTTSSQKTGRTSGDIFCQFYDGTAKAMVQSSTSIDASASNIDGEHCYNCWCFGPMLVNNGNLNVTSSSEVYQATGSNERSAIGYFSPYHFCFFTSDVYNHNRTSSGNGLSLYEEAKILKNLGCVYAYNLDGGGSSMLYVNGAVANSNSEGTKRSLGDIIYVKAS